MKEFLSPMYFGLKAKGKVMIALLLAGISILPLQASDSSEALTIVRTNVKVFEILSDIEQQSGLKFFYSNTQVDTERRVSINLKGVPVTQVLDELFKDTSVEYKIYQNYIVLKAKQYQPLAPRLGVLAPGSGDFAVGSDFRNRIPRRISIPVPANTDFLVTGVVISEEGEPLPGVNIVEKGTTRGSVTDVDGKFSLSVSDGNVILTFSFIGYVTQEVPLNNRSSLNITMAPEIQTLSEVVVVGYGLQEKISITNSIAQISGEDLERRPVASFEQSLQGIAPGVTVLDQGGRPGASAVNIRVRGITTLGDNNPLIIVDGIEQEINEINPNDIESVSVLKDASSSAIYGSRAANGVILVTTKRGKAGAVKVSYDGYYAIQDATNRPEHMDLESYLRLENVAHANAGRPEPYTEQRIQEYVQNAPSPEYPLPYPYWRRDDLGMVNPAPQQNHTLSVSGGSEAIQARMSIRHQEIEGIVPNFSDALDELRLNMDLKASEKFKFRADLNYRVSESIMPSDGESRIFQYMLHASKFSWPKHPTGEYGLGPQVNNPLVFAELTGDHRTVDNYITGSIKGEYEILPGLNFSTQYAVRNTNTQVKSFANRYYNRDPVTGRVTQRQINSLTETRLNIAEYTLNSLLNYTKQFDRHRVTAMVGYSTVSNKRNQIGAFRQDFYNNDVQSLSQGSNDNKDATGADSEWGLRSYFSRLNYNYRDRYFLELNGRYDGSSRFSESKRYSFFPSFSAGWRMSEEAFWTGLKPYVNEFKLRGSRGVTGNQAVGLYAFFETLSSVPYSFEDQAAQGFAQSRLANRNLTWETTEQTDIGFDMGLLEDHFLLTFDYYDKRTEGILLELPIPALIGLEPSFQNAGVVQNKGYEISLNYRGGKALTYDIGVNFSDNRNEVLDLVDTGPYITGSNSGPRTIIDEGLPINSHWGYLTDGFFQTQEEADNYPTLFGNTRPGDVKYLDRNGDGIISEEDHEFLGLSFPKHDFGFRANLYYKNFEFLMQWQGASGHKTRLDGAFQQVATFETFTHAIYTDNYWTPERPNARFARPIKGNGRNYQTSDYQMINASYLRLKNIILGYNIPAKLSRKVFIERAKVYVGATNLLTFSELNEWDLDPEIPSGRGQYYPQVKMYTIGLNLGF